MELWDARIYFSQSLPHYKGRCVMYILHNRGTVVGQWPQHTGETKLVLNADSEMSLPSKSSTQSVEVPCFWLPMEELREKLQAAALEQLVFLNRETAACPYMVVTLHSSSWTLPVWEPRTPFSPTCQSPLETPPNTEWCDTCPKHP